jgi:hypothetical protein
MSGYWPIADIPLTAAMSGLEGKQTSQLAAGPPFQKAELSYQPVAARLSRSNRSTLAALIWQRMWTNLTPRRTELIEACFLLVGQQSVEIL